VKSFENLSQFGKDILNNGSGCFLWSMQYSCCIYFFLSLFLSASVFVVVAADSERSKSHDVFELGVQCGWSALMFRRIIQRCCR